MNRRPTHYECVALPTELYQHIGQKAHFFRDKTQTRHKSGFCGSCAFREIQCFQRFPAFQGLCGFLIEKKESGGAAEKGWRWLWYAIGSAVFASLTAILGKVGISGVESNLGTAIRTVVVLVMSWIMVFVTGKREELKHIPKNELGFICLSGLATGGSWLCYYKALQDGPASVVVPVDKLSILVTVLFSYVVFHEKLTARSAIGLAGIVVGTLLMLM